MTKREETRRPVRRVAVVVTICGFVAAPALAGVVQHTSFASYDAAVGSNHDIFLDFETDKFGTDIATLVGNADGNGFTDIVGNVFSDAVAFSSPDHATFPTYVNLFDGGHPTIQHQLGPMGSWDGALQIDLDGPTSAVAWTGASFEATTTISFYDGATLVDSVNWAGGAVNIEFGGFVADAGETFDRVVIEGLFYSIDGFYATSALLAPIPAPLALPAGAALLASIGLFGGRGRRA